MSLPGSGAGRRDGREVPEFFPQRGTNPPFASGRPPSVALDMAPIDVRALLRRPLVVAPMAGGTSTPALVAAAGAAGALGFLAGGYQTAAGLLAEIDQLRAAGAAPFGVNLFVPSPPAAVAEEVERYAASLQAEAGRLGCRLGEPAWDDDGWDDKLAAVLDAAPPVVSFTFGCPEPDVVEALRRAGSAVAVTVTTVAEAMVAAGRGADILCSQGLEAGGHRGLFRNDGRPVQQVPVVDLVSGIAAVTDLPQLAAGGVAGPDQVREVLAAGAVAAQCGTAFLRCSESGAHPLHKAALADPAWIGTALTRAFSGRPARGLVNRFMADHPDAPAAYPQVNNLTRPLRAAAAAAGDTAAMSLWAGMGFRSATDRPAGEIVEMLAP